MEGGKNISTSCPSCGGSMDLDTKNMKLICPYCGNTTPLDAQTMEDLRARMQLDSTLNYMGKIVDNIYAFDGTLYQVIGYINILFAFLGLTYFVGCIPSKTVLELTACFLGLFQTITSVLAALIAMNKIKVRKRNRLFVVEILLVLIIICIFILHGIDTGGTFDSSGYVSPRL